MPHGSLLLPKNKATSRGIPTIFHRPFEVGLSYDTITPRRIAREETFAYSVNMLHCGCQL